MQFVPDQPSTDTAELVLKKKNCIILKLTELVHPNPLKSPES